MTLMIFDPGYWRKGMQGRRTARRRDGRTGGQAGQDI